jgi:hypothetical protein
MMAAAATRSRQRYINQRPWHDTYGVPNPHEHHH